MISFSTEVCDYWPLFYKSHSCFFTQRLQETVSAFPPNLPLKTDPGSKAQRHILEKSAFSAQFMYPVHGTEILMSNNTS